MCDCDCHACVNCEHDAPLLQPREPYDPKKHPMGFYFTNSCVDCGKRDWDDSMTLWPDFKKRCLDCYVKLPKESRQGKAPT